MTYLLHALLRFFLACGWCHNRLSPIIGLGRKVASGPGRSISQGLLCPLRIAAIWLRRGLNLEICSRFNLPVVEVLHVVSIYPFAVSGCSAIEFCA